MNKPNNFYRMQYLLQLLVGTIPMGKFGKKGIWSQSKSNSGSIPMPFKQWRKMSKTMERKVRKEQE